MQKQHIDDYQIGSSSVSVMEENDPEMSDTRIETERTNVNVLTVQKQIDKEGQDPPGALKQKQGFSPNGLYSILAQIIPLIASLILTYMVLDFVHSKLVPTNFIYRLIVPANDIVQQAIPAAIVFIFLWTMVDLLLKAGVIFKQSIFLKNKIVLSLPDTLRESTAKEALQSILQFPRRVKKSLLFHRFKTLLDQLEDTADMQNVHDQFRHQSDIDAEISSSDYTGVRLFIWAMPILGFIGTVIGIGLAVGNFSGFLTGDIENIDVVKTELSKVATGLSFAFNTTLLGLVSSLLAMLFASFVQKKEECTRRRCEELGLQLISNSRNGHSSWLHASEKLLVKTNDADNGLKKQLGFIQAIIEKFTSGIDASAIVFQGNCERLEKSFVAQQKSMENFNAQITEKFLDLLQNSQEKMDSNLARLTEEIGSSLKTMDNVFSANGTGLIDGMKSLADGFATTYTGMVQRLNDHQKKIEMHQGQMVQTFSEHLSSADRTFSESIEKLAAGISDFSAKVDTLSEAEKNVILKLWSTTEEMMTNVQTNMAGLVHASQSTAVALKDLVPAQRTTAKAVDSINELSGLIVNLQKNQEKLLPLLHRLASPMEVRLVSINDAQTESAGKN